MQPFLYRGTYNVGRMHTFADAAIETLNTDIHIELLYLYVHFLPIAFLLSLNTHKVYDIFKKYDM